MQTLTGGVMGCGFFAQNQLHAWADLDGAQIVALCDHDEARLGIARTYTDPAQMLSAERLDFVDIAAGRPRDGGGSKASVCGFAQSLKRPDC